jgi:hypothetical protein
MNYASAPMFGKYVKHIDTQQIIEWKCYDPDTELLVIRWPTGSVSIVHRRGVVPITPHEEMRFLRLRIINPD